MTAPQRARKGSMKDYIGIYVQLSPELYHGYVQAAAERGITKRRLVEAALLRELERPTVYAVAENQRELPLKTA